uniref:Uncharacterized protein n=1 Tax=Nelumbo nucifera TaxID=4432 RepID=A0A822XP56_NELNU|nr:TPA_asm: hypothetical protein HUJ06_023663 [Nelumbo nucifera]
MPRLSCGLKNAPKLKELPPLFFSAEALRTLYIKNCPQLTWTPFSPSPCLLQQLEELELEGDVGGVELQRLLFMSIPVELQRLTSLQKLGIYRCHLLEERCKKEVGEDG